MPYRDTDMYHKDKEFSASPVTSLGCDPCHSCSAGGAVCAFSAWESCSLFSVVSGDLEVSKEEGTEMTHVPCFPKAPPCADLCSSEQS